MRERANLARTTISFLLAAAVVPASGDDATPVPLATDVCQVVVVTTANWEASGG